MNAHFDGEYELSELGILVGSYAPQAGDERVDVMPDITTRRTQGRSVRIAVRRRRGAHTPEALLAAVVARQSGPHAKHRVR